MTKDLCALYQQIMGHEPATVEVLPASGSGRHYYRMKGTPTQRSVFGPRPGVPTLMGVRGELVEENHAFIYLSGHFREAGLPVPRVLAVSDDRLCYVQEDLGSTVLFDAMAGARKSGQWGEDERRLLRQTMRLLADVQMRGDRGLDYSHCYPQPAFDRRTINWDLAYFKNCFLRAAGVAAGIAMREDLLEDDFERMTSTLLAGGDTVPWGFMYRDFQSRNVMVRDWEPWLIDYQGGRRGPCLYDVASFLWQARACYPEELRQELLGEYIGALRAYHPELDEGGLRRNLQHFVAFRILQTLGAYGFRGYFERKTHFIQSVPPALANLQAVFGGLGDAYPYLCRIIPLVAQTVAMQAQTVTPKPHGAGDHASMQIAPSVKTGSPSSAVQTARSSLTNFIGSPSPSTLTVSIHSFSYRRGLPDDPSGNGGGFVFDCRAIHNPGRYEQYKQMTGMDEPVIRFLEEDGGAARFLTSVYALVDASVERYLKRGFTHLSASFGCTGGQHRSVYCAQQLAQHLRKKYPAVRIELVHRERGLRQVYEAIL